MEQPIRHDSKIVIEEVTDPEEIVRHRIGMEHFKRNLDWIQAHWNDVLPHGWGKYLAVAGQETFLADTPQEARAWAEQKHPEDQGAWIHYLKPAKGPRIYENRRRMAAL
jgi:hypothetical protein